MLSLKDYFPFSSGADIVVRVANMFPPLSGTGRVARSSKNIIEIEMSVGAFGIKKDVIIILDCKGNERGNYIKITVDGETIEDDDVFIQAFPNSGRLRIDPSVEGEGHSDLALSVNRVGTTMVELSDITGIPPLRGATVTLIA